jgi:hypothetical protein
MAYCRFGTNDLYVFMHVAGHLECCGCILQDEPDFFCAMSTKEMIDHVSKHRESGHVVPYYLESNLLRDDAENFPNPEAKLNEVARAICDSEAFMWLMVGANHPDSHIELLRGIWREHYAPAGGGYGARMRARRD